MAYERVEPTYKWLRDIVLTDRLTKLSSEVHLHLPNA